MKVHRIIAETFLQHPDDFTNQDYEINHIDCNRANNNVDNLEWMRHKDNVRYSIQCGNHICTTDLTGKNNPNYQNHILSEIYRNNPQLAQEKLARPGSQNGHAVKIALYDSELNLIANFDWIGECALYLQAHNITKAPINNIRDRILHAIKYNKPYLHHYFKRL